ncbi:hypothetical protein [Crossiella sp. NPDC003009]
MNVDDELRRLFSDDRLELRPLPDAEHAVLTGVKRRQRRRRAAVAATGALSALAVVAGTLAVLQPEQTNTVQPADTTSLTFTTTPAPTSAPSSSAGDQSSATTTTPSRGGSGVGSGQGTAPSSSSKTPTSTIPPKTFGTELMGPVSYRGLRLGMPQEQAVATGLIKPNAKPESNTGCFGYDYAGSPRAAGFYSVVISKAKGVVRINGRGDERTSEGIGVGAPVADFDRVYPKYGTDHGAVGERVVAVPGNAAANYWFIMQNNSVKEIRLELKEQDCYP